MFFLVVTHRTARYDSVHAPAHQQFLAEQRAVGVIRLSGPFSDGEGGGAYVIEADDIIAARRLAERDPMVVSGATGVTVREWSLRYVNLPNDLGV